MRMASAQHHSRPKHTMTSELRAVPPPPTVIYSNGPARDEPAAAEMSAGGTGWSRCTLHPCTEAESLASTRRTE